MSNGTRALVVLASSAGLGALYFQLLAAQSFPPDILRFVPALWLAGAVIGGVLSARALRSREQPMAAWIALVLNVPNVVLALVFSMAALMGD